MSLNLRSDYMLRIKLKGLVSILVKVEGTIK